ncbi:MAG TPA: carotenoid biosynthesis protein [Candidatus Acidoferrales bacterium]|nr:carotenoid biosynthesis protein [Candidatus Acidoferrales bacterium]
MPAPASSSKYVFWGLNGLLGAIFIVQLAEPGLSTVWDGAMIALAAVASVAALGRRLPLQNVLPAALITAGIGGSAHALSGIPDFSLPFGPIIFNAAAGPEIFNTVPWTVPLLWVIAIFNGRGVARLILRPWRKVKNYGLWLIGLTGVLAMAFDLALEPFAWHVKHFWLWRPTRLVVTWQGTNLLNFLGWAGVALLIMMLATPLLIRKQPGHASAPDVHPLVVWLGALALFAAGSARIGEGWPVAMDAAIALATTIFAVRGMKW